MIRCGIFDAYDLVGFDEVEVDLEVDWRGFVDSPLRPGSATGGRLRHFSKHPIRYRLWTWVSKLNANHARYAWVSLFSVALVDLYIVLLANGTIEDVRFF